MAPFPLNGEDMRVPNHKI